jgi:hypothetical protein
MVRHFVRLTATAVFRAMRYSPCKIKAGGSLIYVAAYDNAYIIATSSIFSHTAFLNNNLIKIPSAEE